MTTSRHTHLVLKSFSGSCCAVSSPLSFKCLKEKSRAFLEGCDILLGTRSKPRVRGIKGWRNLPSALASKSSQENCFCLPGLDKSINLSLCFPSFLRASSQFFCTNTSQCWARVIDRRLSAIIWEENLSLPSFSALNCTYQHNLKGGNWPYSLSILPLVMLSLLLLTGLTDTSLKVTDWCHHLPLRPFSLSLHSLQWCSSTFFSVPSPASTKSQHKHPRVTWDCPCNDGQAWLYNLQVAVQNENVGALLKKGKKEPYVDFVTPWVMGEGSSSRFSLLGLL